MSGAVRPIEDGQRLRTQKLRGERVTRSEGREQFLGKPAVAGHYDVSTTTIDEWCRAGMPYRYVGKRRKFRLSETDGWMLDTGRLT